MDELFGLADWLEDCSKEVKNEIELAVKEGAKKVQLQAQQKAPFDTGNLRNNIDSEAKWEGNTCIGKITSNAEYSVYVEYGSGIYASKGNGRQTPWRYQDAYGNWYTTRGQAPQPFMYPAWYAKKDEVFRDIVETIGRFFD